MFFVINQSFYLLQIVQSAPWTLSDQFIEDNKIDFVAHDDIPYGHDGLDDIYGPLKARGMFVATERTEGVSTSDIVARIVKDYDLYVRRNLARGYSAKELNVSFLSEKKFRLQNKMDELKSRGKRELTKVKGDIITKWEEKSREFIDTFLLLFGRERLNHLWNESKGKLIQALSPPGSPSGSVNGDDLDADANESSDEYLELPTEYSAGSSSSLNGKNKRSSLARPSYQSRSAATVSSPDDYDDDNGAYDADFVERRSNWGNCETSFLDLASLNFPFISLSLSIYIYTIYKATVYLLNCPLVRNRKKTMKHTQLSGNPHTHLQFSIAVALNW